MVPVTSVISNTLSEEYDKVYKLPHPHRISPEAQARILADHKMWVKSGYWDRMIRKMSVTA